MAYDLNQLIPNLPQATQKASSNIMDLLNGSPNPGLAQNASAYYGVTSGMPGSDYVRNRGFDLYNTQADQRRQQGLQGLLSLLGGVSGTATLTPGEQQQNSQFNKTFGLQQQQLGQQQSQFNQNLAFQKWLESQKLGLEGGRLGIQALGATGNLLNSYLSFLD